MENPFNTIEEKLNNIEALVLDIKNSKAEKETDPRGEQFLSVQETAEFLNLSVPTIYGLTSKSLIPFMKTGKRLYFLKSELVDYLKQGRNKTQVEISKEAENFTNKKGCRND